MFERESRTLGPDEADPELEVRPFGLRMLGLWETDAPGVLWEPDDACETDPPELWLLAELPEDPPE